MNLRLPALALATVLAVALPPTAGAAPGDPGEPANSAAMARYLVTLTAGTDLAAAVRSANAEGARVTHVYGQAINGYAADMNAAQVAALSKNPNVVLVEPDQVMTTQDTQTNATWGLDRIDQRDLPLSTSYNYDPSPGAGVTAYIIDTGVLGSHADFGGRVATGYAVINGVAGVGNTDCNGHGTHVAGTVAGSTYGVAKNASIVPIRILGCSGSGSTSDIVAGINWVINQHGTQPAVANMSLGGVASSSLDNAVTNMVNDGITVAVAAGNSNADACNTSPARAPLALTVGATDRTDARSSFSNYGTCLDIFAPGSAITSAWKNGSTNTISGTSMASPHVAGAAAVLLGKNPSWSPASVGGALTSGATSGKVTGAGNGSPNRLLYSESAVTPTPTPSPTPTVTPTPSPTLSAPSPATNVTARAGSSKGSASVTWTQGSNGGSTLTSQTVKIYRASTLQSTVTVAGTVTSLNVTRLTSGSTYSFGIIATNAVGSSSETISNLITVK